MIPSERKRQAFVSHSHNEMSYYNLLTHTHTQTAHKLAQTAQCGVSLWYISIEGD